MSKQQPIATKKNIRAACGMLKSKTSVTKELLKDRAKDKKREEAKLTPSLSGGCSNSAQRPVAAERG